jgi:hypothetical protein
VVRRWVKDNEAGLNAEHISRPESTSSNASIQPNALSNGPADMFLNQGRDPDRPQRRVRYPLRPRLPPDRTQNALPGHDILTPLPFETVLHLYRGVARAAQTDKIAAQRSQSSVAVRVRRSMGKAVRELLSIDRR